MTTGRINQIGCAHPLLVLHTGCTHRLLRLDTHTPRLGGVAQSAANAAAALFHWLAAAHKHHTLSQVWARGTQAFSAEAVVHEHTVVRGSSRACCHNTLHTLLLLLPSTQRCVSSVHHCSAAAPFQTLLPWHTQQGYALSHHR
jgi:hypothetical protein